MKTPKKLIIEGTGEVLDFNSKIESLTDAEKSDILTRINLIKRLSSKLENRIKKWIKEKGRLKFDDEGEAFFEDWKVRQIPSKRFSETKLMKEGTEPEKKVWLKLKEKYSNSSQYIRFG
jgi:hypothetical protein